MRSLVGLVRAAGSSLLITSETAVHGLAANAMDELLFLFDNVIDLRYIEEGSLIGRAVHVAKMRNSWHEMTLNSVTITDRGLVVGNELEGVTGRLGWSALRSRGPLEPFRPVARNSARPSLALTPQRGISPAGGAQARLPSCRPLCRRYPGPPAAGDVLPCCLGPCSVATRRARATRAGDADRGAAALGEHFVRRPACQDRLVAETMGL